MYEEQLELEFKTADERLRHLGLHYWKIENGAWTHKTSDLELQFDASRNGIPRLLREVCVVTMPSFCCARCCRPPIVESRAQANELVRQWSADRSPQERRVCARCLRELNALQREAALAIEAQKTAAIQHWASEQRARNPARPYAALGIRHAFLLLGLLRYGAADWQCGKLDAWEQVQPKLWSSPEQLLPVYEELFAAGWIQPAPSTSTRAFDWADSTITAVRPLQLTWLLAEDSNGQPVDQLEKMALSALAGASSSELAELWDWVCINEVRDTYHYYGNRFEFHGLGWTKTLESNVAHLLQTCSVGQVRSVMRSQLTRLSADLNGRVRPRAHTYNMLSGELLRSVASLRGNNREIFKANRLPPSLESLYTGLLFDEVMQGGTDLYNHATGENLKVLVGPHTSAKM